MGINTFWFKPTTTPPKSHWIPLKRKWVGLSFNCFFTHSSVHSDLDLFPHAMTSWSPPLNLKKGNGVFFFFQWKWWCITPLQCDILWWWTWLASLEKGKHTSTRKSSGECQHSWRNGAFGQSLFQVEDYVVSSPYPFCSWRGDFLWGGIDYWQMPMKYL